MLTRMLSTKTSITGHSFWCAHIVCDGLWPFGRRAGQRSSLWTTQYGGRRSSVDGCVCGSSATGGGGSSASAVLAGSVAGGSGAGGAAVSQLQSLLVTVPLTSCVPFATGCSSTGASTRCGAAVRLVTAERVSLSVESTEARISVNALLVS